MVEITASKFKRSANKYCDVAIDGGTVKIRTQDKKEVILISEAIYLSAVSQGDPGLLEKIKAAHAKIKAGAVEVEIK